jgi:hypothetical protein
VALHLPSSAHIWRLLRINGHRHVFAIRRDCRIALLSSPTRGIHVVTAAVNKRGETMNATAEETGTALVTEEGASKRANRKPSLARSARHGAPAKAKATKKASPGKKAPRARKTAKVANPEAPRDGSKTAHILDLLKRPGGATTKELMEATAWQPHSVRGFLSGTVRKKMGLNVTSTKGEDGQRSYSVKA